MYVCTVTLAIALFSIAVAADCLNEVTPVPVKAEMARKSQLRKPRSKFKYDIMHLHIIHDIYRLCILESHIPTIYAIDRETAACIQVIISTPNMYCCRGTGTSTILSYHIQLICIIM